MISKAEPERCRPKPTHFNGQPEVVKICETGIVWFMLSRRMMLVAALTEPVIASAAPSRKMTLCLHQNTSIAAGFRKSLEGWAKAGIKNVELSDRLLEEFLKTDSLAAARRLLGDLGLTPVCGAAVQPDFWNRNPGWAASLEAWKQKCGQYAELGLTRVYAPSTTTRTITAEDYKAVPDCIRQAGAVAKQHNLTAMIEFTRSSTLLSTLTSRPIWSKITPRNSQP